MFPNWQAARHQMPGVHHMRPNMMQNVPYPQQMVWGYFPPGQVAQQWQQAQMGMGMVAQQGLLPTPTPTLSQGSSLDPAPPVEPPAEEKPPLPPDPPPEEEEEGEQVNAGFLETFKSKRFN